MCDLRSFHAKFARHIPRGLLEGSEGKRMALTLTGVGRGDVLKGAFKPRIKNAFLRGARLKHYQTSQNFTAIDTTHSDWGDPSCQSLDVQVDRPSYVHGAVADINGSFREVAKLRQKFGAH